MKRADKAGRQAGREHWGGADFWFMEIDINAAEWGEFFFFLDKANEWGRENAFIHVILFLCNGQWDIEIESAKKIDQTKEGYVN